MYQSFACLTFLKIGVQVMQVISFLGIYLIYSNNDALSTTSDHHSNCTLQYVRRTKSALVI